MGTLVAYVDDELVFQEFLNGFVGLSALEIANACDELFGDVLMIPHTDFDSC
jgi:hypothetical protein